MVEQSLSEFPAQNYVAGIEEKRGKAWQLHTPVAKSDVAAASLIAAIPPPLLQWQCRQSRQWQSFWNENGSKGENSYHAENERKDVAAEDHPRADGRKRQTVERRVGWCPFLVKSFADVASHR